MENLSLMLLSIVVSLVHYNTLLSLDLNSPMQSNKPVFLCMILMFPTIIMLNEFFDTSKVLLTMVSTSIILPQTV
jgi:hypothetical protein